MEGIAFGPKPIGLLGRPLIVVTAGADDEMDAFLVDSYPPILRAVMLICDSRAAAEDAVHEALARAWEHRRTIEDLERWVLSVALNQARSRWRKVGRREVALSERPAQEAMPAGDWVDLHRAIRALPRRQREVVVLHYFVDLPVREVAQLLGITPGGVKHALFRARRTLGAAVRDAVDVREEPT